MTKQYPYWVYVVGVFAVWAIVLAVASQMLNANRFHNLLIFGCGFLAGVLGVSIARKVYR